MATFVLVHGAWHGGWVWKYTNARLREYGHLVAAPTLSGLGDRAHARPQDITLQTHVDDVVAHVEMEDLHDIDLVGWSYGGMVITGVLAAISDRIRTMTYLDAFVPAHGDTLIDNQPPDRRQDYETYINNGQDIPPVPLQAFGITDQAMLDFAGPRIRPQPVNTFNTPIRALDTPPPHIPHIYIRAMGFDPSPFKMVVEQKIKSNPHFTYYEIDAGHDAMLIKPVELADLLMATTQPEGASV